MSVENLVQDGENQAVRVFLRFYHPDNCATTEFMREMMAGSGYPHWPEWAFENELLTKASAQAWIRYLFSLEPAKSETQSTEFYKGIQHALHIAEDEKANITQKYIDRINQDRAEMNGNMNWARLEGAVCVVEKLKQSLGLSTL